MVVFEAWWRVFGRTGGTRESQVGVSSGILCNWPLKRSIASPLYTGRQKDVKRSTL